MPPMKMGGGGRECLAPNIKVVWPLNVGPIFFLFYGFCAHTNSDRLGPVLRLVSYHTGVGTGGQGGQRYICAPLHSDPEFRPKHRAYTDICDVTLARLALRFFSRPMCPPPPHFVTFLRRCTTLHLNTVIN